MGFRGLMSKGRRSSWDFLKVRRLRGIAVQGASAGSTTNKTMQSSRPSMCTSSRPSPYGTVPNTSTTSLASCSHLMTASKPESFRMRAPAFGSRTSLLQQAVRDEACCNKKQLQDIPESLGDMETETYKSLSWHDNTVVVVEEFPRDFTNWAIDPLPIYKFGELSHVGCGCLQKLSQSSTTDVQRFMRFQSTKAPTVSRERVECVVIGAGVVGLAIARELAMVGREVWVIEADTDIGTGISSRNSEVIHAGIYYPPGSLKAKLCVEGRQAMYSYCEAHGVPYKRAGKLIVATQSQQVPVLEKLAKVGKDNGVTDLCLIKASEAQEMEPQLQCVKALWSPSSGILDSHSFMLALQADAEEHGASFAFNTSMIGGAIGNRNIEIYAGSTADLTAGETTQVVLCANMVINSTGLHAQSVARSLKGLSASTIPKSHYARGCYFSLSGVKSPFSHLIYPVPEDGGLGCHVTMDLSGQIKFGPDVEWLPNLGDNVTIMTQFDYTVEPRRMDKFYSEIRKYYPSLPDSALQPDYAGIRPKLSGSGELTADFLIQGEDSHGVPGLVQLYGIESPGLTACLAIAKVVCAKLCK